MPKIMRINDTVKAFCQDIAASPNFANSCKQIYVRTSQNQFRLLRFFKQNGDFSDLDNIKFLEYCDYYITKNSFVANKRGSDCLFSLDNIVIDIDWHNNIDCGDDVYQQRLNYLIDKLLYLLDVDYQGQFPPHYNIVRSGRGVQLWIGLQSCSAKLLLMCKLITTNLCDILKKIINDNDLYPLEVDYTSADACHLVRLPGTYNTHRSDYIVQTERRTDYRYTLAELIDDYPIIIDTHAPRKHARKAKSDGNFEPLHAKRLHFIDNLVDSCGGNCIGLRDKILFLYYNAAVQVDEASAEEKMMALNDRFCEPLAPSELSLITRYIDKKGYLKFADRTFLAWLDADAADYYSVSATTAHRAAARDAKKQRNQQIIDLKGKGYSVREIAAKVGCAPGTVQSVIKSAAPPPPTPEPENPKTEPKRSPQRERTETTTDTPEEQEEHQIFIRHSVITKT